jgi:exopolysaccharide production protein ExoZ
MESQNSNRYLDILQIYRGIAALMVVIHHSAGSLKYYHNLDYPTLNYIGKFGKLGVDFFFILSGFIISYSAYYKYKEPDSFKKYLKNRIIRVYVPYLPIGILMYLLYTNLPGFSNGNREISLFTSLTLFPKGNPALSVAWTLTFELCFYVLFSISFYSRKVWNYFAVVWFILILVFNYSPLQDIPITKYPLFKVLFSPYNVEFIIGYLLSLLIIYKVNINLKQKLFGLIIILLSIVFLILFPTRVPDFYLNYIFAGLLFFMLYVTINTFNKKINKDSLLMLIGNASYSIYLIHNPLQMLLIRFYPKVNSLVSLIILLLLVFLLSSFFGYLYYLIFEKKCMEFIKSKITRS